eukprot:scaffold54711_cov17-Tisochrysis_lutea.AAC.2
MRTLIKVHLDCQNLRLGFLHAASNKPDRKDPSLLPPTDLHMKDNEWAMSKYPFVPGAHREHTPGTHSGSRERVGWAWAGSETAVGAAMHASKGRKMCAQRAMKNCLLSITALKHVSMRLRVVLHTSVLHCSFGEETRCTILNGNFGGFQSVIRVP